jgi:hypothetical protein
LTFGGAKRSVPANETDDQEAAMVVSVGTFNLNNLFSRFNFEADVSTAKKSTRGVLALPSPRELAIAPVSSSRRAGKIPLETRGIPGRS